MYKPQEKNREILDVAMGYIKAVPYKPSLRWVFYRLLQHGYYNHKNDYKEKWTPLCSRARKKFYGEWRPDTLTDDTRDSIDRVGFYKDENHFRRCFVKHVTENFNVTFDPFFFVEEYVCIGFEARAMINQFEYYTAGINLFPFGGETSIPFKWALAKHFEVAGKWYRKPMRLLYFGDLDKKGQEIFESARKDVTKWCDQEVYFEWCGLTEEQVQRFGIPEDPENPGKYQWEALDDKEAKELIFTALTTFHVDTDAIRTKIEEGERVTLEWRPRIEKAIRPLLGEDGHG